MTVFWKVWKIRTACVKYEHQRTTNHPVHSDIPLLMMQLNVDVVRQCLGWYCTHLLYSAPIKFLLTNFHHLVICDVFLWSLQHISYRNSSQALFNKCGTSFIPQPVSRYDNEAFANAGNNTN